MIPPLDAWAARVMEALLRVRAARAGRIHSVLDDEIVSAILLEMRVGTFAENNKNAFKRYNADIFRCHICNHVLPRNSRAPDTMAHLQLHRQQVRAALNPDGRYTDNWEFINEPTEEEVRQADDRLQRESDRTQARLSGFDIILKTRKSFP